MVDTSVVRVHQHGACIADNNQQDMGRSRGGLTSKIHAEVDTNGLPVRLALTPGEAHDNRQCSPPQRLASTNDAARGSRIRRRLDQGACPPARSLGEYSAETKSQRPDLLQPVSISYAQPDRTAESPLLLPTLERQLLLISGRPGVRIADTALEEIGSTSGHFRLVVYVNTWHIFTSFGIDNLGSSAVGPWQTYATGAFNSYLLPGDTLALNLSTTPGDPRELAFGRLSYDVSVDADGARIGASAHYSEFGPATTGAFSTTSPGPTRSRSAPALSRCSRKYRRCHSPPQPAQQRRRERRFWPDL
jgi:hypothetical protein